MKQCIALAGVACLVLSGCAQSGFLAKRQGQPAHVARSMSAPRPQSARASASTNINGLTQVDFQESLQFEGSYGAESYDAMEGPYAMEGSHAMGGSYAMGSGCDDACCGDGYCDAGCCSDGMCSDGMCGDGMCGDGCFCGNGAGNSLRNRCDRMDRRALGLVNGIASGFCPHRVGYPEPPRFTPGPPTGQVAYPYYTVRGPRDFLQSNPPTIGPR